MKNLFRFLLFSGKVESDQVERVQTAAHNTIESAKEIDKRIAAFADRARKAIRIDKDVRGYVSLVPLTLVWDTGFGYLMLNRVFPDFATWLISLGMAIGAIVFESVSSHFKKETRSKALSIASYACGLMIPVGIALMTNQLYAANAIISHGKMGGAGIKILLFGCLAVGFHVWLFIAGDSVREGFHQLWNDLRAYQAREQLNMAQAEYTHNHRTALFLYRRLCDAIEAHNDRSPDHKIKDPTFDPVTERFFAAVVEDNQKPPDHTPRIEMTPGPRELPPSTSAQAPSTEESPKRTIN